MNKYINYVYINTDIFCSSNNKSLNNNKKICIQIILFRGIL